MSCPEAVPLSDLDPESVKKGFFFFSFFYSSIIWSAGYSAAQKKAAEATTEVEKAYAEIELTAYSNMGRALEIAL